MYLLNGFFRTLLYLFRGLKTIIQAILEGSLHGEERTPILQHSQSLTAGFEDYDHSLHAVRTCLLHCLIYYAVAVASFSFLVEHWPIVDSLYFATVLFTTIGYGDLSPTTSAGQVVTICLCLYGITILGVFLGIYGGSLVEANEQSVKERQQKLKQDIINQIEENLADDQAKGLNRMEGNLADEPPRNSATADEEDGETEEDEPSLLREFWGIMVLETPVIILVLCVGMLIGHFEGWNIIESVYWTVITGTTVGFGDKSPQEASVRLASVFFLPLAVAVLGEFLGRVAGTYVGRKRRLAEKKFFEHSLTLADIRIMDTDKNGKVDRAEFLTYMLVALQRVDRAEIDSLNRLFQRLDKDKSGALSAEDLRLDSSRSYRQHMTQTPLEVPME